MVETSNPACGDILRLSARFDGGAVTEVRYQARGCTASIAAGSALTVWMAGKRGGELAALRPEILAGELGGLSAESMHAAVLCCDAVKALLHRLREHSVL
jgi:nitrogen fixation NifU-like protein